VLNFNGSSDPATYSLRLIEPDDYNDNTNIEAGIVTFMGMLARLEIVVINGDSEGEAALATVQVGIVVCQHDMPVGAERAVTGLEPQYSAWNVDYGGDNNLARADWLWHTIFTHGLTGSRTEVNDAVLDKRDSMIRSRRRLKDMDVRLVAATPGLDPTSNNAITIRGYHRSVIKNA